MTLFVPDVSHHQGDINIQALRDQGAAALIARVGQGTGRRTGGQTYGTTQDRKWARNLAEARRVGLTIIPYWYIGNLISADENARLAGAWVGDTSLPWMLDHEDASGSIAFYHEVRAAFARRGLRVVLGYVPRWYWEGAGGRAPLAPGPPLVSSRYSTAGGTPAQIYAAAGGDNGAGWQGYGGGTVALWQFTNKASMAGQAIDCSAFRGTRTQLAALLGGTMQEADMDVNDPQFQALAWKAQAIVYDQPRLEGGPPGVIGTENKLHTHLVAIDNQQAATQQSLAALKAKVDQIAVGNIDYPTLVKMLADELDRRARDGDPTTGPTT